MYIVYEIINTINHKGYIGYTGRSLDQRWRSHLSASKYARCRFHFALREYGPDPWTHTVLEEFENVDDAKRYEAECILHRGYLDNKKDIMPNLGVVVGG